MILLATLLAMQQRIGPPQPILPPTDPRQAMAVFERLCVRPFPDPTAFDAAIAGAGPEVVKWQPNGPLEALVTGSFWQAPTYTVRYSTGSQYAPDLPHPQCSVTAAADPTVDAETLFPLLTAQLRLSAGKVVGRKTYRTAMWDLPRGADRWRVIFGTERQRDRLVLKLSMMDLGGAR